MMVKCPICEEDGLLSEGMDSKEWWCWYCETYCTYENDELEWGDE